MASGIAGRPPASKDAVESLIQRYFVQLTRGCGHKDCANPNCATGSGKPTDPNKAAAVAIALAQRKKKGYLCVSSGPSNKNNLTKNSVTTPAMVSSKPAASRAPVPSVPPQSSEPMDTTDSSPGEVEPSSSTESASSSTLILVTSGAVLEPEPCPSHKQLPTTGNSSSVVEESSSRENVSMEVSPSPSAKKQVDETPTSAVPPVFEVPYLTEAKVREMIEKAESSGHRDYKELTNNIWLVFSNPDSLNKSFLLPEGERAEAITVDVGAVRRTYISLFSLEPESVKNTMVNAMEVYCSQLQREKAFTLKQPLNHFVVLFENPLLHSPEFMKAFPKLLQAVAKLPVQRKELLIHWYSYYSTEEFRSILSSLQQLITLQLLFSDDSDHPRAYLPQSDPAIVSATKTMTILCFANLLKAKREGNVRPMSRRMSSVAAKTKPEFMQVEDSEYEQLLFRIKVHPANVTSTPIPFTEFLNEELNSRVNMGIDYQRDYSSSMSGEKQFSFIEYPFILNAANKVEKLFRDNLVSQFGERQRTLFHAVLTGVPDIPFLMLRVDRNNMLSDTLVQLEAISEMNPIDLRKQLMVEFKGEEGIDEGGLQKELFQLLVEKLFDPMYGMFVYDEDTRQHWFNPMSFESEDQYRLIGLLLGLAIYNNIILDICFPLVVYCKLLGCTTVFQDLYSSHPQIARSLKSMLEYSGDPQEFEETYMATFQVSFSDVFDNTHTHNLKEGGDSIPVTMKNRQEYVDLYTDWLLNGSIAKSFDAFKRGFDLVLGQSCLADLFTAEELELLICGSNDWDLDALEKSTHYDGFDMDHPVIINFWQIVRSFTETQKKQLLAFVTGSDRIPLGGMAKLKFIIVKNGPDSDRLPTAHTCFNALLLCDYSSKEKLQDRLTKALSHAKGFGML